MHENYNSGDLYSLKFPGWQQEAMSDVYSLKADSLLKQERYTEAIQFYEKASGYCNCIWNRSKSKNH